MPQQEAARWHRQVLARLSPLAARRRDSHRRRAVHAFHGPTRSMGWNRYRIRRPPLLSVLQRPPHVAGAGAHLGRGVCGPGPGGHRKGSVLARRFCHLGRPHCRSGRHRVTASSLSRRWLALAEPPASALVVRAAQRQGTNFLQLKAKFKFETIDDYIEYFARRTCGEVTGHNAVMMKSILSDRKADPIAIWKYLLELCDKGKIVSEEFRIVLADFWSRFCS